MIKHSCLYVGKVFHRRLRPKEHVLRYSVFSLFIDLDEIDEVASKLWLFSRNRFNLFSFHDSDFGFGQYEHLTDFVHRQLSLSGVHTMPTRIQLSCYPRVLGYAFNPLSVYYCFDDNDTCYAIVHEVHNTFGERHAYTMRVQSSVSEDSEWINQQAVKELFVSPFAHMGMQYQFRLNRPDERQVIVIRASDKTGLLITASYTAKRRTLAASSLAALFFNYPVQGLKVITGIHWEALKLFAKRVPWFKHQPKNTV